MIPDITASKQEWRQYCRLCLGRISQQAAKARLINDKLLSLPEIRQSQHILTYYPLLNEVDITAFNQALIDMGKKLFLPFFHKQAVGRYSKPLHYDNKLNAYEPSTMSQDIDLDLVIIPGMAFDKKGFRLGKGKGWYDKYLNTHNFFKVAVSFDELVFDKLPHESHDVKIDMVITPQTILKIMKP
jgi:5-formyltetrahydrofolate cyclo-ligase